jgi:acetyl esterase
MPADRDYNELRERRLDELDEETAQIYRATGDGFGIPQLGVEAFRELFHRLVLHGGDEIAAGVKAETVAIPGPAGDIPARLYVPEEVDDYGVFIHTHGGGFIAWNGLENVDAISSGFAARWGCAVVHPDFRVPPEDKFPASVDDCWATVEWVAENAGSFGADAARIAVGGGCTGANLAAVMALLARDAGRPKLAVQYLYAPQLDLRCDYRSHFEFAKGYGLSRADDLYAIEQYLRTAEDRWDWRASPALVDSVTGVCPAVIAAGEYEILRDESRLYAGRLRDASVEVHYFEGPGQGHGHTYWRNTGTGEYTRAALQSQALVDPIIQNKIGGRTRE